MTADEISKMDYKQLRNAVLELNDNYVKLKRLVEDALFNIDEANLSAEFSKKLGNSEAKIDITAEKISSVVSSVEDKLKRYSTIEQTSDEISMAVSKVREHADGTKDELTSKFDMTAEQIATSVENLGSRTHSSLKQTAEMFEAVVGKYYDTEAAFKSNTFPPVKALREYDENKLCLYNGKYYYYNTISKTWRQYNVDDGARSAMKQTAHGFCFTNDVAINGDLLTYGTISGIDIAGVRFWGNKDCVKRSGSTFFRVISNLGDIGLFKYTGEEQSTAVNGNTDCVWAVSQRDLAGGKAMRMYSYGKEILGYNHGDGMIYPMGYWKFPEGATLDLRDCTVIMPSGLHLDGS